MKINILGTEYDHEHSTVVMDGRLRDCDGYTDTFAKTIVLDRDMIDSNDIKTTSNPKAYTRKVLRHETIHAFFSESGLRDYSDDEVLVDWIAVQAPKMFKLWKEIGALDDGDTD